MSENNVSCDPQCRWFMLLPNAPRESLFAAVCKAKNPEMRNISILSSREKDGVIFSDDVDVYNADRTKAAELACNYSCVAPDSKDTRRAEDLPYDGIDPFAIGDEEPY